MYLFPFQISFFSGPIKSTTKVILLKLDAVQESVFSFLVCPLTHVTSFDLDQHHHMKHST